MRTSDLGQRFSFILSESDIHSRLHQIGFAAVLAITIYVIIDWSTRGVGLFQVADFDQLPVDLRASMR